MLAQALERTRRAAGLSGGAVLVGLSGGKDSLVTLDVVARGGAFSRVEAMSMYLVPGLECFERPVRAAAARYGIKVHFVPHHMVPTLIKNAVLRPHVPGAELIRETNLKDVELALKVQTGIDFFAYGERASDSYARRLYTRAVDGVHPDWRRLWPIWDWSTKQVRAYLQSRRIPLPTAIGGGRCSKSFRSPTCRCSGWSGATSLSLRNRRRERPMAKDQSKAKPPAEATLSKFQKFEPRRVHRRDLKNAKYNPRTITEHAKKKLRKVLSTVGLIEAIVWNESTGNIVGGHQRVEALDTLERTDNYLLDVNVVSMSPTEEREANAALNNPNIQGSYDGDLLAQMFKDDPAINLEHTGFDPTELMVIVDDPDISAMFAPNPATSKVLGDVQRQQEAADVDRAAKAAATKKQMQEARARNNEEYEAREDTEVYAIIVCRSRDEREALMRYFETDPEDRYIDFQRVLTKLPALPSGKA